jgi:hypothetical protein
MVVKDKHISMTGTSMVLVTAAFLNAVGRGSARVLFVGVDAFAVTKLVNVDVCEAEVDVTCLVLVTTLVFDRCIVVVLLVRLWVEDGGETKVRLDTVDVMCPSTVEG